MAKTATAKANTQARLTEKEQQLMNALLKMEVKGFQELPEDLLAKSCVLLSRGTTKLHKEQLAKARKVLQDKVDSRNADKAALEASLKPAAKKDAKPAAKPVQAKPTTPAPAPAPAPKPETPKPVVKAPAPAFPATANVALGKGKYVFTRLDKPSLADLQGLLKQGFGKVGFLLDEHKADGNMTVCILLYASANSMAGIDMSRDFELTFDFLAADALTGKFMQTGIKHPFPMAFYSVAPAQEEAPKATPKKQAAPAPKAVPKAAKKK